MQFAPALRLSDEFQGRVPQLSVGGGRVMERSVRSEGKVLEYCGALLHGGEALLSFAMAVLRLVERRNEKAMRAVGNGGSKNDHCALYRD